MGLDTGTYLTGTSLNALPPQNLQFSEKGTLLVGNRTLVFKPLLRHAPDANDFNSAPGNCPLLKLSAGSIIKAVSNSANSVLWVTETAPPPNATGRCSPYKHYWSDSIHY